MTETNTTDERPTMTVEQLTKQFEDAPEKAKNIMRFSLLMAVLLNDAETGKCATLERRKVRADLMIEAMKELVASIEFDTCETMVDAPKGMPLDSVIGMIGIRAIGKGEAANKRMAELLDLYSPDIKESMDQKADAQPTA